MSGASGVRTGAPGSPVGFAEDAEVLHPTPREFRVTRVKAPRVWIIDEEWDSVDVEIGLIRESYPDAQILHSSYNYEDDLDSFGRTCDVLIAQVYAPLPASTIERLECCRGIAVMGGGFDRVDVGAAGRRGFAVTNVQGYCAEDLAQYVLTAILTHAKPLVSAVGPEGPRPWGLQAYPSSPVELRTRRSSSLAMVGSGARSHAAPAPWECACSRRTHDPIPGSSPRTRSSSSPGTRDSAGQTSCPFTVP